MKANYDGEVLYYTFPEFEKYEEITHAFSSREGGVSGGFFRTMNLGINTEDSKENILDNYKVFAGRQFFFCFRSSNLWG